jgi:hypothetical protein
LRAGRGANNFSPGKKKKKKERKKRKRIVTKIHTETRADSLDK